jgi:hypothetical protein
LTTRNGTPNTATARSGARPILVDENVELLAESNFGERGQLLAA